MNSQIILQFTKNKKFRILMLSDMQERLCFDSCEKTFAAMRSLIEDLRPDLVVLGGDNGDESIASPEELRAYLDRLVAPMEENGIPWMHVFGNHDHDMPFDDAEKEAIYESYPHCISYIATDITGTTNYCVPVVNAAGDKPLFMLWALDCGNRAPENITRFADRGDIWEYPHFDQLAWYYYVSLSLEEDFGRKIPGLMFQHILPQECKRLTASPELCGTKGETSEKPDLGALNSGQMACVLQRGDIRLIAAGHSHCDTFEGNFAGITLTLDGSAGYHPYGEPQSRGGRLFLLSEDGSVETAFCLYN